MITANLAAQFALTGERVGVVDTDIQSPGIHVLFGLDEHKMGKTLNDYLHGKATIREVGYSVGANTVEGEGRSQLAGKELYLFPSSIKGKEISQLLREGVDFNKLNEGLQTAMTEFDLDYLFIDTHPGLHEITLLTIATADIFLIVLTPDHIDLQRAQATIDITQFLEIPKIQLLINKAHPKYDPESVKREIAERFNLPAMGVLPLSFDLFEYAGGYLFSLRYPDHDWSIKLRMAASKILTTSHKIGNINTLDYTPLNIGYEQSDGLL
ncbi:MAG: AAA family ATPase [Anaerolineales bacterium]|nr:AAA family ATPase [Anaerolineales bacterium]